MRIIPIPIASRLNSEAKPGRHTPDETPFIQNMRLESGIAVKSMGFSVRFEKGAVIGAHRIDASRWLIVAADSPGQDTANIYLWESGDDTFTALTLPADFTFEAGYDDEIGKYKPVFFDECYDTRTELWTEEEPNADPVDPCVVTIITNGVCTPLMYRHNEDAPDGLYVLPSAQEDDVQPVETKTLEKGAKLRAEKVAALKDVLYWGNLTNFDSPVDQTVFDHRLIWSVTKHIDLYNDWTRYKDFTQGGDKLTGIKATADNLFAVREASVWQTTTGYDTFARVAAPGGSNCPHMAEYFGRLVYNSYGKIIILGESNPFLSELIHTLFSGEGIPEDVRIEADEYGSKIYVSTGQKLFVYDFKHGTWSMDQFSEIVQVVGVAPAGTTPAGGWSDPPDFHDTLSIAEEDTICDPVIILGGTKLCKLNHFYRDMPLMPTDYDSDSSPLYDAWLAAGGTSRETVYETPLVPLNTDHKYGMAHGFLIEGKHTGNMFVKSYFADSVQKPDWENIEAETVQLESDGTVQLDVDSGRCRYAAFRISTNDKNYLELSKLGMLVSGGGRR